MRLCSRCRVEDRPLILRDQPCTCSAGVEASDVEHVEQMCRRVSHWVVEFPKQVQRSQLIRDPEASHGWKLPNNWRAWKLVESNRKFYRTRELCRDCIAEEAQIDERRRDYQRSCEKLRDAETMTYSNLLARN